MSDTNGGQAAGWYPDPELANTVRYWDGTGWTEHRAPATGSAAPVQQSPGPAYATPSSSTGGKKPPWLLIGGAALALVLIAVVIAVVLNGGGSDKADDPVTQKSSNTPSSAADSTTFSVSGQMSLTDSEGWIKYGGVCGGVDGYDDIDQGTQVVILDSDGTKLALGALDSGHVEGGQFGECVFTFHVEGVPKGLGVYSVEVGHRGEISFSEDEANTIALSLG